MRFEWHEAKSNKNLHKHGVSFSVAITAFDDPFGLIAPDKQHSTVLESREWLIGESDHGVLVIVFTVRQPQNVYRIISARRANRRERSLYEKSKRVSL